MEIYHQLGQRNQFYKPLRLSYRQYRAMKRAFDLLVSLLLLPILLLPMALISLIILLESRGSPLFVQERVGYGGRRFDFYKFRTMRQEHDDEAYRAFMKAFVAGKIAENSPEEGRVAKYKPIQVKDVTRVGRVLRKTSLDELPQIFNVIRGDMSLIGPRPNVLWEVEAYRPWHNERLNALPGITGLAQVLGRSEITFDQIARHDIQYVRNQSLDLDLWIVGQSVRAIIGGDGAG